MREAKKDVIIVVDDEPEIAGMLVDCLEARGYLVLAAGGAAEALRLLELHPETGLLLTDIVMPGDLNGFDLAQRAKRAIPGIQVVFMTAHGAAEMIGAALPRPPIVLRKPFWIEHLVRIAGAAFVARAAERIGSPGPAALAPVDRTGLQAPRPIIAGGFKPHLASRRENPLSEST